MAHDRSSNLLSCSNFAPPRRLLTSPNSRSHDKLDPPITYTIKAPPRFVAEGEIACMHIQQEHAAVSAAPPRFFLLHLCR